MAKGVVKFFSTEKGFGFIKPDSGGGDIFVHISAVQRAGLNALMEGQRVSFEVVERQNRQTVDRIDAVGATTLGFSGGSATSSGSTSVRTLSGSAPSSLTSKPLNEMAAEPADALYELFVNTNQLASEAINAIDSALLDVERNRSAIRELLGLESEV